MKLQRRKRQFESLLLSLEEEENKGGVAEERPAHEVTATFFS